MTAHLPVLIVVVPLVVAVLLPLASLLSARLSRGLLLLTLLGTSLGAATALARVLSHGAWHYELGGWAPPWGIEYVIDPLSGGMATLISVIALCVAMYAGPHLSGWSVGRTGIFSSLYLLLTTGLLGIVVTGSPRRRLLSRPSIRLVL